MSPSTPHHKTASSRLRFLAASGALALAASMGLPPVAANAVQAPVGAGFTITPADLSFILKQIKIAEAHAANTTSETGPCGALVGTGPNQLASPLLSHGLRTVDGSCNNLQPGQETFGASDQVFPRLGSKSFGPAESGSFGGPPKATSYAQKSGSVFDSRPRTISNLIADQTSTNPAAVAAAGFPARTQGNEGVVPCTTDPDPEATPPVAASPDGCVPSHNTLFIPNVTTDVGLSPPYNSLFTLFGQFFDHGIDQTVKGGGTVYVPLKADDPLIAGPDHVFGNADDLNPHMRFMVLTRGQNQPGQDGILGTADDVQDALNTNSPWVDQSQTYSSHASHHVFLREYVNNPSGRPVATGNMLGGPEGTPAEGGMATWADTKKQARELLGIQLLDKDALNVPMLAADPYGKFIPGPKNGLPQFVTRSGLVEADRTADGGRGTLVPQDVLYFNTPFLTDIAHNADPSPQDADHNPATPPAAPAPDADTNASADFLGQAPGTYDDEMLNAHFIAGDGRVNENIGLTAIHQVFHSEHDRVAADIKRVLSNDTSAKGVAALAEWKLAEGAAGWNGERLFQAARFVTEMEYQHLVFEEFARKIQPALNIFEPFAFAQTDINPAVSAEFAHAVYRFGHSMLTETISRRNEDSPGADTVFGTPDDVRGSQNDISLLEGFLNPPAYTDGGPAGALTSEEAAGSIIMGMSDQVGSELDEFVTDTLRNKLLGLPMDLAAINLTRARSEGLPTLNNLRRELHGATNDGQLKPYTNWIDFGENIKHPKSLVNFVAAYGTHPSILEATTLEAKRTAARLIVSPDALAGEVAPEDAVAFMNSTDAWANNGSSSITGLDDVDLWMGGLAERTNLFGGLLGSTFNYVFESQMTDLQNGDRLYYLARTPGMNLMAQLEGNSFAEMMMRNTNAQALKADAFATADCKFELKNLNGTAQGFASAGNTVADDPSSECNETALLIRMPDGTIKYRASNSVDPAGINGQAVYNGSVNTDRIHGGVDNDTMWGGPGNDVIEGNDGADTVLGGDGNDIITDSAGDDILKGGPDNDAIDGGPGLDLLLGGDGRDFVNGGANSNETFAGEDDDFVIAGEGLDAVFGGGGNDWAEGGDGPDLLIGDSSNLFFLDDSQRPGNDVLVGQGGDDDYDMEGGDDIGLAGPGVEKVAGASGYDWETGEYDPQPQDADLDLPIAPLDILQVGVRDRYNEVEALSGGPFDDKLRGDSIIPKTRGGGGFIGCDALDQAGVDRIKGLSELIPSLPTPLADVVNASASKECPVLGGTHVWGEGNILLGGAGSDLLEGRGGDDILDGDSYLSVRLSIRTDPDNAATEIGSATGMNAQYQRDSDGALTGPTLQQSVFAGTVDPANIIVVREILTANGGTDSAVFSDFESNYTITTTGGDGTLGSPGSVTTVRHNSGEDGTDTLRNIEQLVFGDGTEGPGDDVGEVEDDVDEVEDGADEVEDGAGEGEDGAGEGEDEVEGGDEGTDAGADDGIDEVIPGDGEVVVIVTPTPDTQPVPDPAPLEQAPVDQAPVEQAPVNPAPVAQAPVDQTPAQQAPADPAPVAPVTGGFSVRTVDSTGTQVGEILTAEPGATRMVVRGLENGAAYRFQVAPPSANGPVFSDLSEPVVPGATEDQRRIFNQEAELAEAGADDPVAPAPAAAPFGDAFGTAPVVTLAALAHYLSTSPGTAALAITTGGLLAACALLAYKLYRSRANTRKVQSREPAGSTKA
ncbi:animal haem peroxidase family protein [Pseudarthrobacter siccitolerans]|uniref:Animal haem peroxidase family protein n=1 Tax=Pseudarthrobacter siccitolerans TaxID=861266 RepID=A0A024GZD0_9MICC|nr:peroxidase family protein [Pseudarthrobacter siccitolerans]CCQ45123.1 animal haem peroxidase family protein [Pseudarthrobacter siccitolerans]